jgi:hypothetical protein
MHERTWACECLRLASNKARRVNTQAPPGVFNRVTRDRLCRRAVARHRPANGAAPCGESWRSAGELSSQAQLEASNSSLSKKKKQRERKRKKRTATAQWQRQAMAGPTVAVRTKGKAAASSFWEC